MLFLYDSMCEEDAIQFYLYYSVDSLFIQFLQFLITDNRIFQGNFSYVLYCANGFLFNMCLL